MKEYAEAADPDELDEPGKAAEHDDLVSRRGALGGAVCYAPTLEPTAFPRWVVSCQQHIGRRRSQEDRLVLCPQLRDDSSAFFGIFDGTVGDFASENIKGLVLPHLLRSERWKAFEELDKDVISDAHLRFLADASRESFARADAELVAMCARENNHYASSTGVTALVVGGVLTVTWLGDSRAALGFMDHEDKMRAQFLTVDHKPDQPVERARIEASGGSVEYLRHDFSKAFIRGGDFFPRRKRGEKPMQLQYSRAFGGKDLKPYGLSSDAGVHQLVLDRSHKMVILASDGLWDVCSDQTAVAVAVEAAWQGRDASRALVAYALAEQARRGHTADNVTVTTIFFTNLSQMCSVPARSSFQTGT